MDEDVEISRIPPISLDVPAAPGQSAPVVPLPNRGPVWKGKSLQAHQKADMRSIMAEEASTRPPLTTTGSAPKGLGLPGYPSLSTPAKGLAQPPPPSRTPSGVSLSSAGLAGSTPTTPMLRPASRPSVQRASPSVPAPTPSGSQPPFAAQGVRQPSFKGPALGPIITPVRAAPSESSSKRRNQEAWSAAAPPMSVSPPSAGPSTGNVSFLAIQQEQKEALSAGAKGPKKLSLLEIQEQEKARKQEERASREEVEFMHWWAQEEERLRRGASGLPPADGSEGGRGGRGRGRGGRGRGAVADGGRGGRGSRRGPAREKGKAPSPATVGA